MSRSIYQSNGKPLSQQAIYQQKLRQGVFNSPGTPSVGVNSSASDTAALLAASADLTVKPAYERTVAQDAHTAALAAKRDRTPAWSRDAADPYATSAASSVSPSFTSSTNYIADSPPSSKYGVKHGVPAYSNNAVFKLASANSAHSITSRTTPLKSPSKHGLVTKNSSSNSSTLLNINKINQVANQNSTKSLSSRFNPELDYRSGLKKTAPPAEYLNEQEELLAAESAVASLKHGAGYTNHVSSQTRSKSFRAVDVVDATLIAAANAKAQDRLKHLNSTTPLDFKNQAQQYANALTIAQRNSQERIKNHQAGMVNLGGGLSMPQSELDKLASLIVQPVLSDIGTKAQLQRDSDVASKARFSKLTQKHQQAKQDEIAAKNKEKADLAEAKQQRINANEVKKRDEDASYAEYQTERNGDVEAKQQELKDLQDKYAGEKEELLNLKREELERIEAEEEELIGGRKQELTELQAEKDEILKPVLDELTEENDKLSTLVDAKTELSKEVEAAETQNNEYKTKLTELQSKLEQTVADIEKYTADLETAHTEHDEAAKNVDELQKRSIDELAQHEDSHKSLDEKIADLNKKRDEYLQVKQEQKQQILDHIDVRVKDEHRINAELPEHLQKNIDESKLRDTGSLFTIEEPSVKELSILDFDTKRAEHIGSLDDVKEESHAPVAATDNTQPSAASRARTGDHSSAEPESKKLKQGPTSPSVNTSSTSPRKNKLRNRISGWFGSPKGSPTKSRFDEPAKSPTATKPTSSTATEKETKPTAGKSTTESAGATGTGAGATTASNAPTALSNKDRSYSEVSNGEYDEISIDNHQTQGGLFKEEI